MPEIYEHIQFQRETVINERRGKPFNPTKFTGDKSAHAQKLKDELELIKIIRKSEEISGFDDRLLLKLKTMESFDPSIKTKEKSKMELGKYPVLSRYSQEKAKEMLTGVAKANGDTDFSETNLLKYAGTLESDLSSMFSGSGEGESSPGLDVEL